MLGFITLENILQNVCLSKKYSSANIIAIINTDHPNFDIRPILSLISGVLKIYKTYTSTNAKVYRLLPIYKPAANPARPVLKDSSILVSGAAALRSSRQDELYEYIKNIEPKENYIFCRSRRTCQFSSKATRSLADLSILNREIRII